MPLTVFTENMGQEALLAATNIFWRARGLTFKYIGEAGMGGFWTANNTVQDTALVTDGAGPCQIILIHCAAGVGALGHYPAHPDPDEILRGVASMVLALNAPAIDTILFAAGHTGDTQSQQLFYELKIVARARSLYPGTTVRWPTQDGNMWTNLGACAYLPRSGEVALFRSFPDSIIGLSSAANGLAPHGY